MKTIARCIPSLFACAALAGCGALICTPGHEDAGVNPIAPNLTTAPSGVPAFAGRMDLPLEKVWANLRASAKPVGYRLTHVQTAPLGIKFKLSGDPQQYVDCGVIHVPATTGAPAMDFPGAIQSHDYQLLIKHVPYQVKRRLSMEIEATLRLVPHGNQTYYWFEADYQLTRDQSARSNRGAPIKAHDAIRFRNDEEAIFKNAPTRCRRTDRLSLEIENWLRGKPGSTPVPVRARSSA